MKATFSLVERGLSLLYRAFSLASGHSLIWIPLRSVNTLPKLVKWTITKIMKIRASVKSCTVMLLHIRRCFLSVLKKQNFIKRLTCLGNKQMKIIVGEI